MLPTFSSFWPMHRPKRPSWRWPNSWKTKWEFCRKRRFWCDHNSLRSKLITTASMCSISVHAFVCYWRRRVCKGWMRMWPRCNNIWPNWSTRVGSNKMQIIPRWRHWFVSYGKWPNDMADWECSINAPLTCWCTMHRCIISPAKCCPFTRHFVAFFSCWPPAYSYPDRNVFVIRAMKVTNVWTIRWRWRRKMFAAWLHRLVRSFVLNCTKLLISILEPDSIANAAQWWLHLRTRHGRRCCSGRTLQWSGCAASGKSLCRSSEGENWANGPELISNVTTYGWTKYVVCWHKFVIKNLRK